jgi:hypothetical protein
MRTRLAVVVTAMIATLLGAQVAPLAAAEDTGRITGRVVTADGQAPATTAVAVYRQDAEGQWQAVDTRAYSDGTFVVENLKAGRYRLLASSPRPDLLWDGSQPRWSDVAPQWYPHADAFGDAGDLVVPANGTVTVDMVLPAGRHVTGRVLDAAGAPLPDDDRVEAMALGPGGWQVLGHREVEPDGTFDLPQLSGAPYVLKLTGGQSTEWQGAAPYAVTYSGDVATPDDATRIMPSAGSTVDAGVIHPIRNGTLGGRVVDPNGVPVPGVRVEVPRALLNPELVRVTDADGRWSAGPLRAQHWTVKLRDPARRVDYLDHGRDWQDETEGKIEVRNGEATDITSVMPWLPPQPVTRPGIGWADDTRVPAGTLLTIDPGTWDPVSTTTIQWYRGEGTPGARENDPSYRITAADGGADIYAFVTPRSVRPSSQEARYVGRVVAAGDDVPGAEDDPLGLNNPGIDDPTPSVGQTLRVTHAPADASGWRWYRDGTPIPGALDSTYTVDPADAGRRLMVVATRLDRSGEAEGYAISAPTQPVPEDPRPAAPRATVQVPVPTVTLSARSVGRRSVRLTVRVRARGVTTGSIDSVVRISRVRPGPDRVRSVRMKNGDLRVTLRRQPRGRQLFSVTVDGVPQRFARGASGRRAVTVR